MATAAYLNAAKQATAGKREPVIVVRVEDVATIERFYTTQSDWDAAAVSVNMNSVVDLNNVVPQVEIASLTLDGYAEYLYGVDPHNYYATLRLTNVAYPTFLLFVEGLAMEIELPFGSFPGSGTKSIGLKVDVVNVGGIVLAESATVVAPFTTTATTIRGTLPFVSLALIAGAECAASTDYYLRWQILTYNGSAVDWDYAGFYATTGRVGFVPKNAANATLTTATIDLGLSPVAASRFEVDDIKPAGTSITYTAYADDFDPPTTSRGTVTDGGVIGAAGYRYNRIKADFTSSNGARGVLQEIRIIGGDAQFKTFSTHRNIPSKALPLLPLNPVGTLSSKIEIDKATSVGELSFKLLWTRDSGDMVATGYLRNKAIQIQHGFVGLSASDFETIFTGVWANYKADHAKGLFDVSTQNVLKRFMKVKLPREAFNETTGVKTTAPLEWTNVNAVQVIIDLLEELEIPDRYLDRTTIEGLRDGALSSADYNVTRRIEAPEEAWKLIFELATLCGCFVIPLPTGKWTLVLYDAAATPVATLDARFVGFGPIDAGQDKLYTRQLIYYAPHTVDPGENELDYDLGWLRINTTSETAYGESTEHRWFDKWNASPAVITALADRWNGWQGTPRFAISAKKAGGHHISILEGQIVWVKNLTVPVPAASFGVPQKFKALVLKRAFNPTSCTLDFDLLQITDAETA